MNKAERRSGESGNIMVYILVAVVLLAALCYAVAQGGGGSVDSLTQNSTHLTATGLIDYSDTIGKAAQRIRLRGVAISGISFAQPTLATADYGTYDTSPGSEIFNPAGGGIIYKKAAAEATTTGDEDFAFLSGNAIKEIGTSCTDEACADLIMALPNMRRNVCVEINDMLDVGDEGADPPLDPTFDLSEKFSGSFAATPKLIGNTAASAPLAGESEGCLAISATEFIYYKVLLAR
jgi:hypothetical protein